MIQLVVTFKGRTKVLGAFVHRNPFLVRGRTPGRGGSADRALPEPGSL
jgi:hypothetical protein